MDDEEKHELASFLAAKAIREAADKIQGSLARVRYEEDGAGKCRYVLFGSWVEIEQAREDLAEFWRTHGGRPAQECSGDQHVNPHRSCIMR